MILQLTYIYILFGLGQAEPSVSGVVGIHHQSEPKVRIWNLITRFIRDYSIHYQ
ncbi:MAG: hypothetical protein RMI34_04235 [Chloroherpetonaceae bacterium]|nr:hypothetical protein [Chloroherpetonaceae bacterium]